MLYHSHISKLFSYFLYHIYILIREEIIAKIVKDKNWILIIRIILNFKLLILHLNTKSVSLLASFARRFWNTRCIKNEISSHLQVYMWADSNKEQAVYMLLQEEQLSDFFPYNIEFSRFSSGSKLNCSPQCRRPIMNDVAKIRINFESCIILSWFFYFRGKNRQFLPNVISPF